MPFRCRQKRRSFENRDESAEENGIEKSPQEVIQEELVFGKRSSKNLFK